MRGRQGEEGWDRSGVEGMWSGAAVAGFMVGVVANPGHRACREGLIAGVASEPRSAGFALNRAQ